VLTLMIMVRPRVRRRKGAMVSNPSFSALGWIKLWKTGD
jgi:hypothetical protein